MSCLGSRVGVMILLWKVLEALVPAANEQVAFLEDFRKAFHTEDVDDVLQDHGELLQEVEVSKFYCLCSSFHSHGGVYFVPLKEIPIGPESTERFGRGPDPDLTRKVGF